jgi:hypothetical protein
MVILIILHQFHDGQGVAGSTETSVPIVNSKAKEEAFLYFLYKFTCAPELMQWIDRRTFLSKFELHLQGSYQNDWNDLLDAIDPNEDRAMPTTFMSKRKTSSSTSSLKMNGLL